MNFVKLSVLLPRLFNVFSVRFKSRFGPPVCINQPLRPIIVTIIGANSRVGQMIALLLKQSPLIDEIRLYDSSKGPCGIGLDLNHIDTNATIKTYTGLDLLQKAVTDTNIVTICGGEATKSGQSELELFNSNADYVRNVAMFTAEFNPKAVLCIATPPVTAMVPLASEEYKKAENYNPKKIIGVTSLGTVRANTIVANYAEQNPYSVMCPIVGAVGSNTIVPIFSQTKTGAKLPFPVTEVLHNQLSRAEDEILTIKYVENSGPCVASSAYATARFVTSIARGLLDVFDGFECAFVRQTGQTANFLPYMATVIKLGTHGVRSIHMPNMTPFECLRLEKAAILIRQQIEWGESYITGASVKKPRRCRGTAGSCEIIKIVKSKVGDVCVDQSAKV